jgi:hypothetical protein
MMTPSGSAYSRPPYDPPNEDSNNDDDDRSLEGDSVYDDPANSDEGDPGTVQLTILHCRCPFIAKGQTTHRICGRLARFCQRTIPRLHSEMRAEDQLRLSSEEPLLAIEGTYTAVAPTRLNGDMDALFGSLRTEAEEQELRRASREDKRAEVVAAQETAPSLYSSYSSPGSLGSHGSSSTNLPGMGQTSRKQARKQAPNPPTPAVRTYLKQAPYRPTSHSSRAYAKSVPDETRTRSAPAANQTEVLAAIGTLTEHMSRMQADLSSRILEIERSARFSGQVDAAGRYVAPPVATAPRSRHQKKNTSYYAVAVGHKPGVYSKWGGPKGAEAQVSGIPNPRFQQFDDREEAKQWLSNAMRLNSDSADSQDVSSDDEGVRFAVGGPRPRVKRGTAPGTANGGLSPVAPRNPMAFCPHCSQSKLHAGGHPGCCFRDLAKPKAKEAGRDAASRMALGDGQGGSTMVCH